MPPGGGKNDFFSRSIVVIVHILAGGVRDLENGHHLHLHLRPAPGAEFGNRKPDRGNMAPGTRKGSYLQQIEVKEKLRRETLADGRYVPHSGGLMGWFENAGVLKSERANNYGFHTALDAQAVRDKLFERWSDGENINRRASARHDVGREVRATLGWSGGTAKAKLKDYSHHGLRMEVLEEEFGLQKGDETQL